MVTVTVAPAAAVIALLGNVVLDPLNVGIFAVYFAAALLAVGVMFHACSCSAGALGLANCRGAVQQNAHVRERDRADQEINARAVVYFSRGDDLEI